MTLNKFSKTAFTLLILAAAVILVGSCSRKKKISGPDIIPPETLVLVISDIHIMDGITNDMKYYRKYNPIDSIDLYSSIFEKYNVSREEYQNTINEYSKYPWLLDKIYDEVLMNLTQIQDKVTEEEDDQEINDRVSNKNIPRHR